jgi:hypothetical protein
MPFFVPMLERIFFLSNYPHGSQQIKTSDFKNAMAFMMNSCVNYLL